MPDLLERCAQLAERRSELPKLFFRNRREILKSLQEAVDFPYPGPVEFLRCCAECLVPFVKREFACCDGCLERLTLLVAFGASASRPTFFALL